MTLLWLAVFSGNAVRLGSTGLYHLFWSTRELCTTLYVLSKGVYYGMQLLLILLKESLNTAPWDLSKDDCHEIRLRARFRSIAQGIAHPALLQDYPDELRPPFPDFLQQSMNSGPALWKDPIFVVTCYCSVTTVREIIKSLLIIKWELECCQSIFLYCVGVRYGQISRSCSHHVTSNRMFAEWFCYWGIRSP